MIILDSDIEKIQKLIDTQSCCDLLETIADLCLEKGDHIETYRQDSITAKPWKKLAKRLSKIVQTCTI